MFKCVGGGGGVTETISCHVRVGERVLGRSHCSRSSSEERNSFPLGQGAQGAELMRRACGPCKIDHESHSIQIKVNTAASRLFSGCSTLEVARRFRGLSAQLFYLHRVPDGTQMRNL